MFLLGLCMTGWLHPKPVQPGPGLKIWLTSNRVCPGHAEPERFRLTYSLNTALYRLVLLPVCLDGGLGSDLVLPGPHVTICLASSRLCPGQCRTQEHWPHLFPETCAVSTGSPWFPHIWMALLHCCVPRASCCLMARQQQAVPRAVLSPRALAS